MRRDASMHCECFPTLRALLRASESEPTSTSLDKTRASARSQVWQASKAADAQHPYGYAAEQYVWSLISAVGLMFVGCGVSVWHGVSALAHPEPLASTGMLWAAMGVCGLSGMVEAYSLRVAFEEVRREAAKDGMTLWEYVRTGSDPVNVGVLLEDSVAVGGSVVAMGCLGLCMATGDATFDALGSILIGTSLGAVRHVIRSRASASYIASRATQSQHLTILTRCVANCAVHRHTQTVRMRACAMIVPQLHAREQE